MDYPSHIITLTMELSILYFKGSQFKIFIKWCISIKAVFIQAVQTVMNAPIMWHFIFNVYGYIKNEKGYNEILYLFDLILYVLSTIFQL